MPTVTRKGQITLPKSVRKVLGIEAGNRVTFEVRRGLVVLRKEVPTTALARWQGALRAKKRHRTDDLIRDLRGE